MTGNVMIFAPAPQLTVTVEATSDGPELHIHAGGQGVWQAGMCRRLGVSVTMCAALGGETGAVLRPLIAELGVELRAVDRNGSTGWYIHDRREGGRAEVAAYPGAPLSRHDLDELYGIALVEGLRADLTLLSGPPDPAVVPADVYRRLATDLTEQGSRVAADLSGDYVNAVLATTPCFIKISHEELIRDGYAADDSVSELVRSIHRLHEQGAEVVVVSRAEQPALAYVEGELVEVHPPRLEAVDTRGAGDSMTAAVVSVLTQGGDIRDAIRTGAAAGALNVTRHGLGTGGLNEIRELVNLVELRTMSDRGSL